MSCIDRTIKLKFGTLFIYRRARLKICLKKNPIGIILATGYAGTLVVEVSQPTELPNTVPGGTNTVME